MRDEQGKYEDTGSSSMCTCRHPLPLSTYVGMQGHFCCSSKSFPPLTLTLLASHPQLLFAQIAEFYEKFYASKGIQIMKQAKVTAFEGSGKVRCEECKKCEG